MYFGECLNESILYEFNFKESLNILKTKIKNAILHFLDKMENWLKKGKDNKAKQFVINLIQKTRKLLTKVDNANTNQDCKQVSNELNEYRDEFNEKINNYIYFCPDTTYEKCILNKELGTIRALLVGIIGADPTFITTELNEALDYIKRKSIELHGEPLQLEELYEKQEDEYSIDDKSQWNEFNMASR